MDISISKDLLDYEKWISANSSTEFSLFDYLHGIFSTKSLEPDLAIAFLNFFWPEFLCVGDLVFLKEEFSEKRYNNLINQGDGGKNLEYWMNIISISGVFESATFDQSKYICCHLSEIWKIKLEKEFPDKNFVLDCAVDGEDVYLVFYQKR